MNKLFAWGAAVLGVVFIGLAIYYWVTPAGSLPMFFPGYIAGATEGHVKHGIASLLLGIALLIYGWFASAKKVS